MKLKTEKVNELANSLADWTRKEKNENVETNYQFPGIRWYQWVICQYYEKSFCQKITQNSPNGKYTTERHKLIQFTQEKYR